MNGQKSVTLSLPIQEPQLNSLEERGDRLDLDDDADRDWHGIFKTFLCWSSALLVVVFECFIHATCKDRMSLEHAEGDEECLESSHQSYLLKYLSVVEGVCRCTTAVVFVEFVSQMAAIYTDPQNEEAAALRAELCALPSHQGERLGKALRWGFLLLTIYVGLECEATHPADWVGVYAHLFDLLCRVITTTAIFGFVYEAFRSCVDGLPGGLCQRCMWCRYDLGSEGLESFDDHGAWVQSKGSQELLEEARPDDRVLIVVLKWVVFVLAAVIYYLHEGGGLDLPWVFQAGLTALNAACWAAYAWALGHVVRWIVTPRDNPRLMSMMSSPSLTLMASASLPRSGMGSKSPSFNDMVRASRTSSKQKVNLQCDASTAASPMVQMRSLDRWTIVSGLLRSVPNLELDLGILSGPTLEEVEEEAEEDPMPSWTEEWPLATLSLALKPAQDSLGVQPLYREQFSEVLGTEGENGI